MMGHSLSASLFAAVLDARIFVARSRRCCCLYVSPGDLGGGEKKKAPCARFAL
ncbi:hypothetical protein PF005_g23913 [Phytophthora fragariae]|uniref:Uncharacterized protein n=1 Tax=Phytophthora fragariae TaxID=53985 RepID=A0A6A3WZK6_9STRA|nr:hypothetical protein PF003_g2783 [Phytophthora fragariae]KAE8926519.1 hypothetical protein PF009_g23290 [Phytophthora fragariae]KAE9084036.1 hypothetical protein PF007_g21666 [Phytophthora fragariae]KAE9178844.1 hypothetical protein PF005_g23913 [Phytophthora fragariae]KAE9189216.1 hypothetical protein PF002_g25111 [Phytophthora fragariae]